MSWTTINYGYWEFWAPYDPAQGFFGQQKVTIDGENRFIIINPEETNIFVKPDIYSAWKEWVCVRENAKFLPAFSTTGGDPVGAGLYTGDVYFLINDWKIVVDHQCTVNGILYDITPGESPFIILPGGGVINIVSNLAYQYSQSAVTVPTTQEITSNVWNYATRTLTDEVSAEEVWHYLINTPMPAGSAGSKLKQLLTTSNFLALK